MNRLEQVEAVGKMQAYISEHLNEPITLSQLARQAGYSPFHSARMFKELLGKPPFEYIRSLRLSKAALKLRDEKPKVLNIALDFLFDSHEGFTRAFSREFGITPYTYKENPPPIPLFMPTPVKDSYLFTLKGDSKMDTKKQTNTVFVQVIERPHRKVLLKRAAKAEDYFSYCEEVGCAVWGLLCSVKEALYEPIGMWLPDAFRPAGTSLYAQGVEVSFDYTGEVPEGMELLELPPCSMMVFQGQPFEDNEFEEAIDDVWNAINSYNPEVYGYEWADESGPRFQIAPEGWRGYIEARPVRAIKK